MRDSVCSNGTLALFVMARLGECCCGERAELLATLRDLCVEQPSHWQLASGSRPRIVREYGDRIAGQPQSV
jgi:hypothetical protein